MHFFFFLVYICGTFSLLSIYPGFFFFFGLHDYIKKKKKKTYCHIVMVINSKLVIDHDILKNISSQN